MCSYAFQSNKSLSRLEDQWSLLQELLEPSVLHALAQVPVRETFPRFCQGSLRPLCGEDTAKAPRSRCRDVHGAGHRALMNALKS